MGQYYKPMILNETNVKSWMFSHDYGDGLKLMEHSWVGNHFVTTFESLLTEEPQRVVWAGDYADKEPSGDNLYKLSRNMENKKVTPDPVSSDGARFIINHTKRLFVDKTTIPVNNIEWRIHPLPLLTCEGNGQGGGDYYGKDPDNLVGSWARDLISVSDVEPRLGYTQINFNLIEQL